MSKTATLYRMETAEHTCPFGLRAKDLLKRQNYHVDDRVLNSREEIEKIKDKLDVETTPQVIIDETRIGGFEDLERFFGKSKKEDDTSYFPVAALFSIAALLAAGLSFQSSSSFRATDTIMLFIGLSMIMLGLLKLQNIDGFVNGFLGYDILARRYVPYAFVYPFAEVTAGLLMVSGLFPYISVPLMLLIGGVGGISVFKAVYLDKRDLKCACVGGGSNVPLGFVSFSENAVMVGAAIWMIM
ncbi:MauE/DoxX family redox-associated membrane protein [Glaciecola sp. 2405UD65-10]|uniref:MauE/DoxX family redox-associated membrane protein n=1 Tax=Glaciecola sp. 2405UD65-10 TaxID=3397244 RepID=UPI003B5970EF